MQLHYIHMNKCAGTSLQHFLRNLVPESQYLYGEHFHRDFKLNSIDCSMAALIHIPRGYDLSDLPWGAKSVLVLRDPIERLFSDFKMITRWNKRVLNSPQKKIFKYAQKGIYTFLKQNNPMVNGVLYNHYAHNLLGLKHLLESPITNIKWQDAKDYNIFNLSKDFEKNALEHIFKILEKIDIIIDMESLAPCAQELGSALAQKNVSIPFTTVLNKHNSSDHLAKLPPNEREIITEYTRMDQAIYDKAKSLIKKNPPLEQIERFKQENKSSFLNISQGILGENIWPREINYPKFAFWTSQGAQNSKIYISRNNISEGYLNIRVAGCIHRRQIDNASIKVNGHDVELQKRDYHNGTLFLTKLDQQILGNSEFVVVEIIVEPIPAPDPNDPRVLGLEISGMSIIGK